MFKLFKKDNPLIIPYIGYGNNRQMYLFGRALEDEQIDLARKSLLSIFINSFKRFETDEIPNTTLTIQFSDQKVIETITDEEGYYSTIVKSLNAEQNENGWINYDIGFKDNVNGTCNQALDRFTGKVMIPSPFASFGIISDVDDTILQTGVNSRFKWKLILNTFFKHSSLRTSFTGAADLYRLLEAETKNQSTNPIFYVSNSPWNLYRYLEKFLEYNNFPKGPLLLRDLNLPHERTIMTGHNHKPVTIEKILSNYESMKFILFGDASEDDTSIYLKIAEQHPDQVLAIFIRGVDYGSYNLKVSEQIKSTEYTRAYLFNDSNEVLNHLKSLELIGDIGL